MKARKRKKSAICKLNSTQFKVVLAEGASSIQCKQQHTREKRNKKKVLLTALVQEQCNSRAPDHETGRCLLGADLRGQSCVFVFNLHMHMHHVASIYHRSRPAQTVPNTRLNQLLDDVSIDASRHHQRSSTTVHAQHRGARQQGSYRQLGQVEEDGVRNMYCPSVPAGTNASKEERGRQCKIALERQCCVTVFALDAVACTFPAGRDSPSAYVSSCWAPQTNFHPSSEQCMPSQPPDHFAHRLLSLPSFLHPQSERT